MTDRPQTKPMRVLWIDPNVTWDSPSMKGALSALPEIRRRGLEVEIWCLRCDAPADAATIRRLPRAPVLGTLENVWFVIAANAFFVWQTLRKRGRPADVIYTTGAYCLFADVVHVHFDSAEWLRVQKQLGAATWRDLARRQLTRLGAALEWLSARSPFGERFIAVSEGLAASLRRKVPPNRKVCVLGNCYDSKRFHAAVRTQWRELKRSELGFDDRHTVFLFIATGHLQRKGFWSVLRVLRRLRQQGHEDLRLLLVGGKENLWRGNAAAMRRLCPDFESWVVTAPYAREVEPFYAASDAFLFPSHFETFALVAQEALACGLPVFVTPYWGHEMYLRPGENGWLLPWDEDGMAATIAAALAQRPWRMPAVSGHLIDEGAYGSRLADLLQTSAPLPA